LKKNKGEEEPCKKARQYAISICPNYWTEKWDEQRANGNFAGIN